MKTWEQFLEGIFDAPGEGDEAGNLFRQGEKPRTPVSGRVRRKITLPAQVTPPHYKALADKYGHKDRPMTTVDFEPTHRNRNTPGMEAQVLSRKGGVVRMLIDYGKGDGATGSEPEAMFDKNWEPILAPGQN